MGIAQQNARDLVTHRRHMAVAGTVYFLWWFAVESLLPEAFNPLVGRVVIVAIIFTLFGFSYVNDWARRSIRTLFIVSAWLITSHYYYLFYHNAADINWVIGCYITVIAINLYLHSNVALVTYSIFVLVLSIGLVFLVPTLKNSVFLPGLITIVIQANLGLRFRLEIIKNLVRSNQRFQLLFNSAFEGILVHENGLIVDANEALGDMIGFDRSELIGKNILDIIHPSCRAEISERMKKDGGTPYETKGLTKDGQCIEIEVRAKNFIYRKHLARLVAVKDIRDRKIAEKERIAALTMAESVRTRDEFISIASHELKTPISSLNLQTQLIEKYLKKSPKTPESEVIQEFISVFHRQLNRLTELVDTMLDVSLISAGKLILDRKTIDLAALVRDVVATLQVQNVDSNVSIAIQTPDHLKIWADQSRIAQVIENLLTNAIKYGDGKPISITVSSDPFHAFISVEDRGLGIAEEYIERIFTRFERAISPRNISGFGLGLYIIRQIVEAHGGTITVASKLGVGSTFMVRIPFLERVSV